jgi:Cu+-exporting ATPase
MEKRLRIEGMHCASCVSRVEAALQQVPGVRAASVNLARGEALVVTEEPPPGDEALIAAVSQAGYRATVLAADTLERRTKPDFSRERYRLLIAAALAVPVIVISMLHISFAWRNELLLLLCLPLQFWCGWPFLQGAWQTPEKSNGRHEHAHRSGNAGGVFSRSRGNSTGLVERGCRRSVL